MKKRKTLNNLKTLQCGDYIVFASNICFIHYLYCSYTYYHCISPGCFTFTRGFSTFPWISAFVVFIYLWHIVNMCIYGNPFIVVIFLSLFSDNNFPLFLGIYIFMFDLLYTDDVLSFVPFLYWYESFNCFYVQVFVCLYVAIGLCNLYTLTYKHTFTTPLISADTKPWFFFLFLGKSNTTIQVWN